MKSNDMCNCIALYDWHETVPLKVWLDLGIRLFDKTATVPDWANFGSSASNAKQVTFDQLKRRIASASTSGINVAQAMVTRPGYTQLTFGWTVQAAYNTVKHKTILYCWDDRLFNWSSEWICEIFAALSSVCNPTYGIAYQRTFKLGPDLYAYGMSAGLGFGDLDMEEADRIGAWARERRGAMRHIHRLLRDVYPMNLVSREHLNAPISDTTLREWISADSRRGILRSCSGDVSLWIVTREAIREIRSALKTAGLLI